MSQRFRWRQVPHWLWYLSVSLDCWNESTSYSLADKTYLYPYLLSLFSIGVAAPQSLCGTRAAACSCHKSHNHFTSKRGIGTKSGRGQPLRPSIKEPMMSDTTITVQLERVLLTHRLRLHLTWAWLSIGVRALAVQAKSLRTRKRDLSLVENIVAPRTDNLRCPQISGLSVATALLSSRRLGGQAVTSANSTRREASR